MGDLVIDRDVTRNAGFFHRPLRLSGGGEQAAVVAHHGALHQTLSIRAIDLRLEIALDLPTHAVCGDEHAPDHHDGGRTQANSQFLVLHL